MSAVPATLQKRFGPRFQPVHVSRWWPDATAPAERQKRQARAPEHDNYFEVGTLWAKRLQDALPTQPSDHERHFHHSGLIRTAIFGMEHLRVSGEPVYYEYAASQDALFQDHFEQPSRSIAVPPEITSELDAVQDDALEEGFPVPSDELVEGVRGLLAKVYPIAPDLPYMIYPMENGEIAIHVSNEPTGVVLLLCHQRETWCIASIGDSPCRAWFRDRNRLPEAFIREALATLKSGVAW